MLLGRLEPRSSKTSRGEEAGGCCNETQGFTTGSGGVALNTFYIMLFMMTYNASNKIFDNAIDLAFLILQNSVKD